MVEGLAQFYAEVLCRRVQARMPGAQSVFFALLAKQAPPYRADLDWVKDGERVGEVIRVSMIECRSQGLQRAAAFTAAVERHRLLIGKPRKPRASA